MKRMNIALTLLCVYAETITNTCTAKSIEECGRKKEDFSTVQFYNNTNKEVVVTVSQDIASEKDKECLYETQYKIPKGKNTKILVLTIAKIAEHVWTQDEITDYEKKHPGKKAPEKTYQKKFATYKIDGKEVHGATISSSIKAIYLTLNGITTSFK